MSDINLTAEHTWDIGALLGFPDNHFFMVNSTTVMHTWIVMAVIGVIAVLARVLASRYIIIRYAVVGIIENLYDLVFQSLGFFSFDYFSFISALFIFIFTCNIAPLIPFLEEPTQDLNTTIALGLCSFWYTQKAAIALMGFVNYLKIEFFSPLWLFPLHLVGKIASTLSISLRLFGNIFGGAIITKIYMGTAIQYVTLLHVTHYFLFNIIFTVVVVAITLFLSTLITIFFTVLEGFLQAFVFTILSLTYLSIAIRHEGEH